MHLNNLFQVSIKAVLANKVRTLLTSLGIIIGVASVILLVSIGTGIKQYIASSFEDLGSDLLMVMPGKMNFSGGGGREEVHGTATNKLTLKISDSLSRLLLNVALTTPIITSVSDAQSGAEKLNTTILGVSASYPQIRSVPLESGRFFNESEVSRQAKVAVVGTTIVKDLFNNQSPIGQEVIVNSKRFKILGVLESKGSAMGNDQDNQIIVPISTLLQQLDSDKVNYIYVKILPNQDIDQVSQKITNYLIDRQKLKDDQFTVSSSEELIKTINGILSTVTLALGGIAAISLVVGGIGIMNIMLVSVTERTREIGLRKAVGAKPSDILIQFLIEAVALSVLGGIIGILLGTAGSLILNQFIKTSVTIWSVSLAFGFSTLVGVVFGVWPASKAAKLSPIEALRYE